MTLEDIAEIRSLLAILDAGGDLDDDCPDCKTDDFDPSACAGCKRRYAAVVATNEIRQRYPHAWALKKVVRQYDVITRLLRVLTVETGRSEGAPEGWERRALDCGWRRVVRFDTVATITHDDLAVGSEPRWRWIVHRDGKAESVGYAATALEAMEKVDERVSPNWGRMSRTDEALAELLAPGMTDIIALVDQLVREYVRCEHVPAMTTATWREPAAVELAWGRKLTREERALFVGIPSRVQDQLEKLESQALESQEETP